MREPQTASLQLWLPIGESPEVASTCVGGETAHGEIFFPRGEFACGKAPRFSWCPARKIAFAARRQQESRRLIIFALLAERRDEDGEAD